MSKYDHIDFIPPKGAQDAALKAIEWKEEHGEEVDAGTRTGWTRARQLANRDKLSPDVVKRMHSFFSRHEGNEEISPEHKGEPWKDNGYVAWLIWGGDAGKRWAEKVVEQMDRADKKASFIARELTYIAQILG